MNPPTAAVGDVPDVEQQCAVGVADRGQIALELVVGAWVVGGDDLDLARRGPLLQRVLEIVEHLGGTVGQRLKGECRDFGTNRRLSQLTHGLVCDHRRARAQPRGLDRRAGRNCHDRNERGGAAQPDPHTFGSHAEFSLAVAALCVAAKAFSVHRRPWFDKSSAEGILLDHARVNGFVLPKDDCALSQLKFDRRASEGGRLPLRRFRR